MLKQTIATAAMLACIATAYGEGVREFEYKGRPIPVYIAPGTDVHVELPSPIAFSDTDGDGQADIALPATQVVIRRPTERADVLILEAIEPPATYNLTVPTTGKPYVLKLIHAKEPDSWVKVTLPPKPKPKPPIGLDPEVAATVQSYRMAESSPLKDALLAMWFTQKGHTPDRAIFGIEMKPMRKLIQNDHQRRVENLWYYEGRGVYGFTQLVTNVSQTRKAMPVRTQSDKNLHSAIVEGFGRARGTWVDYLDPGQKALVHYTYIGEPGIKP